MTAKTFSLRPIERGDVAALLAMMAELAAHENEEHFLTVDEASLAATGFGDRARWRGFFAEGDGAPIGYVTYTDDYHIWSGAPRIALDDVYVKPAWRGAGVGERLMRQVFDIATRDDALVSWSVQPENKAAIKFYERLGARVHITGKCLWRSPA